MATFAEDVSLEVILGDPDRYIGSTDKLTRSLWVWKENKMVKRQISYVPRLYTIVDKLLVNAADNKNRDSKMSSIEVSFDLGKNRIMVSHNGHGISVKKEGGYYVPQKIFGNNQTGSDYDRSINGGYNVFSAKLANKNSSYFKLEITDATNKKRYVQEFSENMKTIDNPSVGKISPIEDSITVWFEPDPKMFGKKSLTKDFVALISRRVLDLAGCLGENIEVKLEGQRVPSNTFEEYVKLYLLSSEKELPRIYMKVNEKWEVCVGQTNGKFEQISFVNCIATINGGSHVDHITNQITRHLQSVLDLKANSLKKHLWVFVNVFDENPRFDANGTATLKIETGSTCELAANFLHEVAEFVNNLLPIHSKQDAIPKHFQATSTSIKHTLILTEGDSASNFVQKTLERLKLDQYGVFPLKGKVLNVRRVGASKVRKNVEIQSIKRILGLNDDKKSDLKSMKYSHVMILTDQDHDGAHIRGLLLNLFHHQWPWLLDIKEFLQVMFTPSITATHKKVTNNVQDFYTMNSFEKWRDNPENKAEEYKRKYHKGLATFSDAEGDHFFTNLDKYRKYFLPPDENDNTVITLAFDKKKTEDRKEWVLNHDKAWSVVKYYDSGENCI